MELRQMRYFVAVAEELHFGRAAGRLHISTPTLSQQIKAVEREIGAPLLIRHSRGVRLTPAGEVLLRTARETLRSADHALRETRRAAGMTAPILRFGLLNGVPPWLPERIEGLLTELVPGSGMTMHGGTTTDQLRMLENGEVDLALIRIPSTSPPGVRQVEVAEEELGALVSGNSPLATRQMLVCDDLAGRELILFAREFAPEVHDGLVAAVMTMAPEITLSASAMAHAQLRSVLPLRPEAFSLSSPRAAAPPDLVWRPFQRRILTMAYAAAWRSDTRNPAVQALIPTLTRGISQHLTDVR
ncbi:LysR family transcriptional regulator [Spirillospora sp. NPDC048911]|uniref:LysR family transcriptional regulator n=1 Tax=Spirillospora sp. NPDC048911 TaxID=3364527 RepID=UPI003724314A